MRTSVMCPQDMLPVTDRYRYIWVIKQVSALRMLSAIPTFKYVSILHCDYAAMTRKDGTVVKSVGVMVIGLMLFALYECPGV